MSPGSHGSKAQWLQGALLQGAMLTPRRPDACHSSLELLSYARAPGIAPGVAPRSATLHTTCQRGSGSSEARDQNKTGAQRHKTGTICVAHLRRIARYQCACVCVRVCARACVRACVGSDFVLVRECMHGPPVCFCLCSSVRVLLFAPPQGLFGFLHPAFGLRSTFEGFRQILLALCQFGSQPVQFLSSVGAGCPSLITSALLCLDLQHLLIKMCEKSLR